MPLQTLKAMTDNPSAQYIKLVDLFNADNTIGRFLRNVTGFIVAGNTILFAYNETYGEFIRYLKQEKAID